MAVVVVDYQGGNVRSVVNVLKHLGASVVISNKAKDIAEAEHVILPGQGHFGACARELKTAGLWQALSDRIQNNKAFLGICVGFQLLYEESEESPGVQGFGLIPKKITKFTAGEHGKVPHMGWNNIQTAKDSALFKGIKNNADFYFVHSYFAPQQEGKDLKQSLCEYGASFVAAIEKGAVWGCQFHVEKSQQAGLRVLQNFLAI
ncbi:MAG: imidazole glycerol phosphate synthase subunit HisH [Deltaproteobacteria bacterium]|nr:imidazole glycerol phosphate synthase subunit HisH [Deltaproteobacteria bacterium]